MTKGHNKGRPNDPNPEEKAKGHDRHLTSTDKKKNPDRGRNPEEDPSGGTKKSNAVD